MEYLYGIFGTSLKLLDSATGFVLVLLQIVQLDFSMSASSTRMYKILYYAIVKVWQNQYFKSSRCYHNKCPLQLKFKKTDLISITESYMAFEGNTILKYI